jgi:hypothetical protein
MKSGKPRKRAKKAQNQNRVSKKSSNSKTQNSPKKLPLKSTPLTLSMQALSLR